MSMSSVKKTEHCGPKMGRGAFWGGRQEAKHMSSRRRRHIAKKVIREELSNV